MFKKYWKLIIFSLLITLFSSLNVNAYVVTEKPCITKIVLSEQNKIIHNGDRVHVNIKLSQKISKKYICVKFYPDGVSLYDSSSGNSLYYIVNCYYDEKNDTYYGISDPISSNYPETIYRVDYDFIAYNENDRLLLGTGENDRFLLFCKDDYSAYKHFFVFSNACYYGNHTIDSSNVASNPKCKVCGTELPNAKLNASSLKMQTKKAFNLKIASKYKNDTVSTWTSTNASIVSVDKNGKITAKKAGTATVQAKMKSGMVAKCKVTVQKGAVKTTKITSVPSTLKIEKGKTYNLKPELMPLTSSEKITYSSSNKSIATVNSKGKITAKKSGTVKITVKSGSKKVTVKVTVPKVATKAVNNIPTELSIKLKKTYTLKPKLSPSNSEEKITYSSSNKKVATVSSKGKITAKKKGTTVITVKSGKKTAKCKVTVK